MTENEYLELKRPNGDRVTINKKYINTVCTLTFADGSEDQVHIGMNDGCTYYVDIKYEDLMRLLVPVAFGSRVYE